MASQSPTARTLASLRAIGATAQVVEKWNAFGRIRQDLFGCIDVVAVGEHIGILGIQATTADNHSARRKKSIAEPRLRNWLQSGGKFQIWSWSKVGERGKRKMWRVRIEDLTLGDLA